MWQIVGGTGVEWVEEGGVTMVELMKVRAAHLLLPTLFDSLCVHFMLTHSHVRTHARTHACMYVRTHTCTHAHQFTSSGLKHSNTQVRECAVKLAVDLYKHVSSLSTCPTDDQPSFTFVFLPSMGQPLFPFFLSLITLPWQLRTHCGEICMTNLIELKGLEQLKT